MPRSLQGRQAEPVQLGPSPSLAGRRRARPSTSPTRPGCPPLPVADPGGVVGVGGVEAVAVDLHEDDPESVDGQPDVRDEPADGVTGPGDDRGSRGRTLLAVDLARVIVLARPVDRLRRADLRPAEPLDESSPSRRRAPTPRGRRRGSHLGPSANDRETSSMACVGVGLRALRHPADGDLDRGVRLLRRRLARVRRVGVVLLGLGDRHRRVRRVGELLLGPRLGPGDLGLGLRLGEPRPRPLTLASLGLGRGLRAFNLALFAPGEFGVGPRSRREWPRARGPRPRPPLPARSRAS